jgi:hypothetical protein
MLTPKRFERFPRRSHAALGHVFTTLPDAFFDVCLCRDIEQALIGFSVLHYRGGLAVDRQNHRALRLLELLKKRHGIVPKRGQVLNVLGEVQS